jgi:hypothetical protein
LRSGGSGVHGVPDVSGGSEFRVQGVPRSGGGHQACLYRKARSSCWMEGGPGGVVQLGLAGWRVLWATATALVGGRVGREPDVLRGSGDSVSWGHVGAGSAVEAALKIEVANPLEHTCVSAEAGWRGRQESVIVVVGKGGGKAGVVLGAAGDP